MSRNKKKTEKITSGLNLKPYVYREPEFEEKDLHTTSEIIDAIIGKMGYELPNGFTYSLPIIQEIQERKFVRFLLFVISGPYSNRKIFPPRYIASCPIDSLGDLIFEKILPQELNINTDSSEPIGKIERSIFLSENIISNPIEEEKRLNDAVDHLCMIYQLSPESLTDLERSYMKIYQEAFGKSQTTKFLLPAYKAINPNFLSWLNLDS
jgi:hypothetical protein